MTHLNMSYLSKFKPHKKKKYHNYQKCSKPSLSFNIELNHFMITNVTMKRKINEHGDFICELKELCKL